MKKKKLIAIFVMATVLVGAGATVIAANTSKGGLLPEVKGEYSYPVYTGEGGIPNLEYNNIPEDELAKMSTEALIASCLNHPRLGGSMVISSDSLYSGFQYMESYFNGITALKKRDDAPEKLAKMYSGLSFKRVAANSFERMGFEFIIADWEILNNATPEERAVIKKKAIELLTEMAKRKEEFSAFSMNSTVFLIARIEYIDNPNFKELADTDGSISYFLETTKTFGLEYDTLLKALGLIKK